MFVCVIIDLFSRKILSYGISDTIDTVLTMNTFDEALSKIIFKKRSPTRMPDCSILNVPTFILRLGASGGVTFR